MKRAPAVGIVKRKIRRTSGNNRAIKTNNRKTYGGLCPTVYNLSHCRLINL